jgi:hypothetical protein
MLLDSGMGVNELKQLRKTLAVGHETGKLTEVVLRNGKMAVSGSSISETQDKRRGT